MSMKFTQKLEVRRPGLFTDRVLELERGLFEFLAKLNEKEAVRRKSVDTSTRLKVKKAVSMILSLKRDLPFFL